MQLYHFFGSSCLSWEMEQPCYFGKIFGVLFYYIFHYVPCSLCSSKLKVFQFKLCGIMAQLARTFGLGGNLMNEEVEGLPLAIF